MIVKKIKQHHTNDMRVVYRNQHNQVSIETTMTSVLSQMIEVKKIVFPIKGGIAIHRADEIYYCKAQGNYTRVNFSNGHSILLSMTIKTVEKYLPENAFIRCHQSYIVNKNHVRQYTIDGGLALDKIDLLIPVSRRKRKDVLDELSGSA